MIRALFALFLALPSWAQSPGPADAVISVDDFSSCGYVSRFSPNKVKKECFQGLSNVVLDQDYSLLRRNGYALYNQTGCAGLQSVRGMWPFFATDGSQYLIVQSSQSMYSSKQDGLCTPITGLGGLSATAQMSCVQGLGQLWCTNGTDAVFKTNVVSTAVVSQAPLGKYIGFFRNRIVISGVPSNLTSVYLSGELDGTDYTLPTVTMSTSSAILKLNGVNDGLGTSCLMGEYQNGYYIGRNYDTWLLSGYSLADFTISRVDQQVGCMDNNSVKMVNNTLMWLSHRGIEQLTGTQINWVSYPIDNDLQVIINAAGNTQGFTINGNNFAQGNLTASGSGAPISNTIYSGALTVSTFTAVDTTSANFAGGTFTRTTNSNPVGSIALSSFTAQDNFSDGDFTTGATTWTYKSGTTDTFLVTTIGSNKYIYNGGGNNVQGVYTTSNIISSGSWTFTHRIAGSCVAGANDCMIFKFIEKANGDYYGIAYSHELGGGNPDTIDIRKSVSSTVTNLAQSTQTTSAYVNLDHVYVVQRSTFGAIYLYLDGVFLSSAADTSITTPDRLEMQLAATANANYMTNLYWYQYPPNGIFVSRIFDTSFSTPTFGTFSSSFTTVNPLEGNVAFYTQTSNDGVSFNAIATTSDTIRINSAARRYIRYEADFSTLIASKTPTVQDVALGAATTAYYITPCVTATNITSWASMNVDAVNNGGSFSFWTTTGATCNSVIQATATWTPQSANALISNATAPFIGARVLFSVDSATQAPVLSNITFTWNAGLARPPVSAAQYKNNYILFYTTSQASGAANDHALVYNQNGHWQPYDDIPAASSALYLNTLYLGDSNATGKIYVFDSGQSDNGASFNYGFTTPDLDDGDPLSLKQFERAYMLVGAPSATSVFNAINCSYAINGATTTYSLGTVNWSEAPQNSGYWIAKMPFPASPPTRGNWVNISCLNTGSSGPLRIYGYKIIYTKTSWP